jgi:hypothetical protein
MIRKGSLTRATFKGGETVLTYELEFPDPSTTLVRCLRQLVIKAAVPIHVVRNWRRVRDLF